MFTLGNTNFGLVGETMICIAIILFLVIAISPFILSGRISRAEEEFEKERR